jgi:recombination protein RecT
MEKYRPQFELAITDHLNVNRLISIAKSELKRNPKLGECDPYSFVGSLMICAQIGLEPGEILGHMYLTIRKGSVVAHLGYKGMLELARRSGQILSISAHEVYEKDHFEYEYGLNERLVHRPSMDADRGKEIAVYGVARLVNGSNVIEVMSHAEVENVRKRSSAGSSGPWFTERALMVRKTVVRRMFRYLPISVDIQRAAGFDEKADNESFNARDVLENIDAETGEVINPQYKSQSDELAESLK